MDSTNLNVLVEAKKEYLEQLCDVMCPLMIETFHTMYNESVNISKGKKVLIQYQKLLKEVPNWNNHMINQHTENLSKNCSWFSDLLAAVFVSFVKILSSVRLNSENKKISVKLPTNDIFVHGCYIAAAKDVYKDPYVYHEMDNEYERDTILHKRFKTCIEQTVKEMLPVQKILHTYMSSSPGDEKDVDLESHLAEETEDPEIEEGFDIPDEDELRDPETDPDPEPIQEPEPEPEPEPLPELDEEPMAPTTEVKKINLNQVRPPKTRQPVPEPEPEPEDDVLFGDAPEK